jgi:hypothetical protein
MAMYVLMYLVMVFDGWVVWDPLSRGLSFALVCRTISLFCFSY